MKETDLSIRKFAIKVVRIGPGNLRGGSRTATTSKMERFVIIVNGWKPLTIITKSSILDVAVVLDPPLNLYIFTHVRSHFKNLIC